MASAIPTLVLEFSGLKDLGKRENKARETAFAPCSGPHALSLSLDGQHRGPIIEGGTAILVLSRSLPRHRPDDEHASESLLDRDKEGFGREARLLKCHRGRVNWAKAIDWVDITVSRSDSRVAAG